MHMFISGHMAEYLFHLRCLYCHSQQGWEHLLQNLKAFVFKQTNRGGSRGSGNRLEALANLNSRKFAYMLDENLQQMIDYIEQHEDKLNNNTIPTGEVLTVDDNNDGFDHFEAVTTAATSVTTATTKANDEEEEIENRDGSDFDRQFDLMFNYNNDSKYNNDDIIMLKMQLNKNDETNDMTKLAVL